MAKPSLLRLFVEFFWNLVSIPVHATSLLVPRNPNLWVFGAWFGRRYADNSRYLFEHVDSTLGSIRAVWLTRDKQVLSRLRRQGLEAYSVRSFRGFLVAARAGMTIVTSGNFDVNVAAISRSTRFLLWHGTPLKRIKRDELAASKEPESAAVRMVRIFWRTLFAYTYERWDAIVCANPIAASHLSSAFGVPISKLVVTGYPRCDMILKSPADPVPIIERIRRSNAQSKVVLYAPTWRKDSRKLETWLGALDYAKLEGILRRYDSYFVIRPHFVDRKADWTRPRPEHDPRIFFLEEAEIPDLNVLLPHIDVLVTDYSSIYFDFLLLNRPVVFAPFDEAEYEREPGLYFSYGEVTPGPSCQTWDEVIGKLDEILSGTDSYESQRIALSKIFNTFSDTENSRRVAEVAGQLALQRFGPSPRRKGD